MPVLPSPLPGAKKTIAGAFKIEPVNASYVVDGPITCEDGNPCDFHLNAGAIIDNNGNVVTVTCEYEIYLDKDPQQYCTRYTSGWSLLANGTFALGDTALMHVCINPKSKNEGGKFIFQTPSGWICEEFYWLKG